MIASPLEQKALEHLARYGISHLPALGAVFGEESAAAALAGLRKRELVRGTTLPGRVQAIALSQGGVRFLRLPPKRANPKTNVRAIEDTLATTWHCCLGDTRRIRLSFRELSEVLGKEPPRGPVFVLAPELKQLYRIYNAGDASDSQAVHTAGRWIKQGPRGTRHLRQG